MGTQRLFFASPGKGHQLRLSQRGQTLLAHARKQTKKNKRGQPQPDGSDPQQTRIVIDNLDQGLPQAPAPSTRPTRTQDTDVVPGDIYPVFAPKPGTSSSAPWRWDDSDDEDSGRESSSDSAAADQPAWNPRTGFMRTAAELQAAGVAGSSAPAAAAAATGRPSGTTAGGGGTGADAAARAATGSAAGSPSPSSAPVAYTRPPTTVEVSLTVPAPEAVLAGPSSSSAPLPAASRRAVLTSALGTGVWMTVLAVLIRNYAALSGAQAMGTDPAAVEALLRWPLGLESVTEVAAAAGAAAAVTGVRLALLSVWQDLREATERSNQQVLTNLGTTDILLVALVSGVPEELLFRGALVPASFPDWRGVLVSAAIFGALHNSGGRNLAFAAWAGGVGAVYGAAYLATGNVWVPALAHAAANAMSAFVWKGRAEAAKAAAAEAPPPTDKSS